jgi:hypothetical protein
MQLMAGTADMLNVDRRSLTQNIDGGVRYLAQQIKRFGPRAGIAGYNGGPGMAARLESAWPASVQAYVRNVLERAAVEAQVMAIQSTSPQPSQQGVRTAAIPFLRAPRNVPPARLSSLLQHLFSRSPFTLEREASADDA